MVPRSGTLSAGNLMSLNLLAHVQPQIGALVGCNKAALCGDLYSYLLEQPQYATPEQRKALVRRIREALVKCIIINGIPVVMTAVLSIAEREQEADKDYSRTR